MSSSILKFYSQNFYPIFTKYRLFQVNVFTKIKYSIKVYSSINEPFSHTNPKRFEFFDHFFLHFVLLHPHHNLKPQILKFKMAHGEVGPFSKIGHRFFTSPLLPKFIKSRDYYHFHGLPPKLWHRWNTFLNVSIVFTLLSGLLFYETWYQNYTLNRLTYKNVCTFFLIN